MIDSVLTPLGILALGLAAVGGYTDVRSRRIPNWLTVGAFALALVVRALGVEAVGAGLAGAAVAIAVGLALHLVGMLGAGDVKYLAAYGAVLGVGRIWPALILVALAGGLLAMIWTLAIGQTRNVLRESAHLGLYCLSLGFLGSRRILSDAKPDIGTTPIPLGVAIAVGCTLAWFV